MTVTLHRRPAPVLTAGEMARLALIPPAVALDCIPGAWLAEGVRPLLPPGQQPRLFGVAVTAQVTAPDFGAVVQALDHCGPGDVLVIAASGDPGTAMIGEVLSGHLRRRGVAGVVCDGAIRDLGTLAGWPDFAAFCRHVTPRGPIGAAQGAVLATVAFAGGQVAPGDLVLGDDDGLVFVPTLAMRAGLAAAEAKLALESRWIAALEGGAPVAQVFGLSLPEPAAD